MACSPRNLYFPFPKPLTSSIGPESFNLTINSTADGSNIISSKKHLHCHML